MAIRIENTRNQLVGTYTSLGTFFGLATDDPGATATPANEASGGGYARVATTWPASPSSGSAQGSDCTINVGAGTYRFAILCQSASGTDMIDNCVIPTIVLATAGQIVLHPSYTQS
jgi:hypothetical protein